MSKTQQSRLSERYQKPNFLRVTQQVYNRWLDRVSERQKRRERNRGNNSATAVQYKEAIHKAVKESHGIDAYTNERLEWNRLSTYDNKEAKEGGRQYKRKFAKMPTVDHVNGLKQANFKICAWRTNDAKSDLSYREFFTLCKKVVNASSRIL